MTTEELEQRLPALADLLNGSTAMGKHAGVAYDELHLDKVSAAMDSYRRKGWIILSDGCPDCNTPLMRNQEATNQVCVNCEINPPIDFEQEEEEHRRLLFLKEHRHDHQHSQGLANPAQMETDDHRLSSASLMNLPPPTSALPALPTTGPLRPMSQLNHRVSVLDPVMDSARKTHRPPAGRPIGALSPTFPTEFPRPLTPVRPSTPLPRLPKPPAKAVPGQPKQAQTRPPGTLPIGAPPLMSPPASPPAPKLLPRDKRRSPQSSVVVSGTIMPPSTPAPKPVAPSSANLPTPPSSTAIETNLGTDVLADPDVPDVAAAQETMHESTWTHEEDSEVHIAHPAEHPSEAHGLTPAVEDDEERGLESHDEFEDAEEEMAYKPTEEEVKELEYRREQSDRASHLIGQKMLQGWSMLQEPCPNTACNGVPLMRNREMKDFCVVCEKYCQSGQDSEQPKHTVVPGAVAAHVKNTSQLSTPPSTMPPPPRPTSTFISGMHQQKVSSPLASPTLPRARDLNGRISGPIVLPSPAPMSPSFGMTSHQILSRHQSEDVDPASEDEEMRRAMQLIGKVHEFSSRSLPPVPPVPALQSLSISRPTSTYSSSSDKERSSRHPQQSHTQTPYPNNSESGTPTPARAPPASAEMLAITDASHKTMSTLLAKLEVYRLALEVSEDPKECQTLVSQIKSLMECLKACREVL